ncbi:MAG TPA: hypothetical protein VGZ52_10195, partial [Acidimicrobiales bacterium]|nr:hypothetical protein [Acidimicrobiales bacterium]
PLRFLHDAKWDERPLVIGVGDATSAAILLALGGRAAGIALVDAPVPPQPADPETTQRNEYAWLRAIADDPESCSPALPGRADPRLRHGLSPRFDDDYATHQREALTVPVLDLDDAPPQDVLAAVAKWWACAPPRPTRR